MFFAGRPFIVPTKGVSFKDGNKISVPARRCDGRTVAKAVVVRRPVKTTDGPVAADVDLEQGAEHDWLADYEEQVLADPVLAGGLGGALGSAAPAEDSTQSRADKSTDIEAATESEPAAPGSALGHEWPLSDGDISIEQFVQNAHEKNLDVRVMLAGGEVPEEFNCADKFFVNYFGKFFKLMGQVSVEALAKAVKMYPKYAGFNAILGNKQRKELETLLETMSEGAEWPVCAGKIFAMITGPAQGEKQVADSGADPLVARPSPDSSKDVATQTPPSASADGATQTGNSADSGVAAIAPASVGSVSPMPVGSSSS